MPFWETRVEILLDSLSRTGSRFDELETPDDSRASRIGLYQHSVEIDDVGLLRQLELDPHESARRHRALVTRERKTIRTQVPRPAPELLIDHLHRRSSLEGHSRRNPPFTIKTIRGRQHQQPFIARDRAPASCAALYGAPIRRQCQIDEELSMTWAAGQNGPVDRRDDGG